MASRWTRHRSKETRNAQRQEHRVDRRPRRRHVPRHRALPQHQGRRLAATARRLMGTKRAAFWVTVAGVSILANFGLEVVANRWPQLGLAKFTAFTHHGKG